MKMDMETIEKNVRKMTLLSPAGSRESLIAAVQNGADAVYLGGSAFNARRFADNFDDSALRWAFDYCHARGVAVHVTFTRSYLIKNWMQRFPMAVFCMKPERMQPSCRILGLCACCAKASRSSFCMRARRWAFAALRECR